jgi:hypothetical protein
VSSRDLLLETRLFGSSDAAVYDGMIGALTAGSRRRRQGDQGISLESVDEADARILADEKAGARA